ncbi:MAG: hypothetical protein AMS17_10540 [Spirochaetes bacterium DG_61]|nr:MAG: hypothetical protein AMS17_10540 [Spirochaetes bacterium DG_61]
MPSIKDVAKLAGVSVSTVSRVINESEDVDERTRATVLDAIKKLDYKPSFVAKGLRGKSGNLIGLVVPESMEHAFTSIINYTIEVAYKKGFNVILGNTHNDPDIEEKFIDDLLRRNVDGILFSRVSDESRVLHKIGKTKVPIVIIDRTLDKEGIPGVVLNNYKAGSLAAKHLCELGHNKIACITGPLNIALCRERLRGFKDVLKENNIEFNDDCVYEGNFKYISGIEAVRHFRANNFEFTAIWAQNDMMALGVLRELLLKGIRVPQDISVMGMDDIGFGQMMVPSLTSIHYPFREMCEKAIDLLITQKEQEEVENKMIVLEPNLVVRDSTGQPFHQ